MSDSGISDDGGLSHTPTPVPSDTSAHHLHVEQPSSSAQSHYRLPYDIIEPGSDISSADNPPTRRQNYNNIA